MRHLPIAAVFVLLFASSSAFAFDPCFGAHNTARLATIQSINTQATAIASGEGLTDAAAIQRVIELMRSPTAEMQANAAVDQAAADQNSQQCEAGAAVARHPG